MQDRRIAHCYVRTVGLIALGGAGILCVPAAGQEPAAKEEPTPRVWIYKDMPRTGTRDTRSNLERHFEPYFFFPAANARKISVDPAFRASELVANEMGTCVAITIGSLDAGDFAGVGFIPGSRLGDKGAYDVTEDLLVGGRPVVLRFRARTKKDDRVKVRFECFGFSRAELKDGIRSTQAPEPELTTLTGEWSDFSVDLTRKAAGLKSVVSPLRVVVRSDDNSRRDRSDDEIDVYVDDLRIEVTRPDRDAGAKKSN